MRVVGSVRLVQDGRLIPQLWAAATLPLTLHPSALVQAALLAACTTLQASLAAACHALQWLAAPPSCALAQPASAAPSPQPPPAGCTHIVAARPDAAPAAPGSLDTIMVQVEGGLQSEPSADVHPPTPCSLTAAASLPPSSTPSVVVTPRALPASPFATLRSRMSLESSPCSSVASFSPQESLQSSLRSGAFFSSAFAARYSAFHPPSQQLSAQHQQQDSQLDSGSLNEPLEELLQHRALEDADLLEPFSPGCAAPPPPPPPPAPAGRGSQRSRVSASWVCWSNGGCSQLATGFPGRRTSNTSTRVPLPWAPALAAATKWSGAAAEQAGPGAAAALPGGAHRAVRCWPGGQCHSGRSAALPPPPLRMSSWHNLSLRASSAAAKER